MVEIRMKEEKNLLNKLKCQKIPDKKIECWLLNFSSFALLDSGFFFSNEKNKGSNGGSMMKFRKLVSEFLRVSGKRKCNFQLFKIFNKETGVKRTWPFHMIYLQWVLILFNGH